MQVTTIGVDLAKSVFQIHGVDVTPTATLSSARNCAVPRF